MRAAEYFGIGLNGNLIESGSAQRRVTREGLARTRAKTAGLVGCEMLLCKVEAYTKLI